MANHQQSVVEPHGGEDSSIMRKANNTVAICSSGAEDEEEAEVCDGAGDNHLHHRFSAIPVVNGGTILQSVQPHHIRAEVRHPEDEGTGQGATADQAVVGLVDTRRGWLQ